METAILVLPETNPSNITSEAQGCDISCLPRSVVLKHFLKNVPTLKYLFQPRAP